MADIESAKFIAELPGIAAATSGQLIVNATGTVATGSVGLASQGTPLQGYTYLVGQARNKASSLSPLTFLIEQVVTTPFGLQVIPLGSLRAIVGNRAYGIFPLGPAVQGTSTLRIVVTAEPSPTNGVDNYTLTVTAY